jgi:NAD+ synthetase
MPVLNPQALIENRVTAIRDYHKAAGVTRAELDVSGGVDSAVMLGLLAKALGPENVTAVYQGINSSPESLERARKVAEAFQVNLIEIDLTDIFEGLVHTMLRSLARAGYNGPNGPTDTRSDPTILGSIRSCLRAPVGRGFNRLTGGGIRHGTGNEDEDRFLRFYQKGGDGEVDTNPIEMLSKGEVYQLAIALGVPREILVAKPSPDLWGIGEKHNDEDEYAAYLGVRGYPFYSYVDPDTGEYTTVGLIERMSRFLDSPYDLSAVLETEKNGVFESIIRSSAATNGGVLFSDNVRVEDSGLDARASTVPAFAGIPAEITSALIRNVKRVERVTRHKWNSNIPMLGTRWTLLAEGILTDDLPVTEKE